MDNIECFEMNMSFLLKEYARETTYQLQHEKYWQRFVDNIGMTANPLSTVQNALTYIKRSHLVLPHLLRFEKGWHEYVKGKCGCDEDFFTLSKMIADCAETADLEHPISKKYRQDFLEIERIHREKMDRITETDFTLKSIEENP